MGGGGGGPAQLVQELFGRAFDNDYLRQGNDAALLPPLPAGYRLVMATDAHVISPLFFPGGDIGSLSVHGTVNDVAMLGAAPLYLSASFVLEEGFPLADLQRIVVSMARASRDCAVPVVTGDTKVVERGKGDGVFISTTGVGMVLEESAIPVLPEVAGACEMLGLDPLYIANEGKMAVVVAPDAAPAALQALRAHPLGLRAAQIGVVTKDTRRFVQMTTGLGGRRVVDWLSGEPLPRIC